VLAQQRSESIPPRALHLPLLRLGVLALLALLLLQRVDVLLWLRVVVRGCAWLWVLQVIVCGWVGDAAPRINSNATQPVLN